jgi:hypothetical protein
MTLNTYSHIIKGMQENATAKLDSFLKIENPSQA